MWGLLGKTKSTEPYNPFSVDLHSHLIPGLDDGMETLQEALETLKRFKENGFEKVITTPHVMSDYFNNSNQVILEGAFRLQEAAVAAGIDIGIEAAAEYYLDETLLQRLDDKDPLLTFGRQRFLLFETSFMNEPVFLKDAIFSMNTNGYTPVLAHPERYLYLHERKGLVDTLLNMNVHFQLNLLSLVDYYSRPVRKFAEKLVARNAIRLVGSDCHNAAQFSSFAGALNKRTFRSMEVQNVLNNTLL
jgi:tyrosine-protein phosphatase YwqE